MILVSDLMIAQEKTRSTTRLSWVLGDGLLYSSNWIYRRIRIESSKIGVRFSGRTDLFDYLSCPHLYFRTLLLKKVIPYVENARPLQRMYQQAPQLPIQRLLQIRKNKILHESAHLVAHPILHLPSGDPADFEHVREFLLATLVSESFASAVEVIGAFFSNDPIQDWMYRINANEFGCESNEYRALLIKISGTLGLRSTFKFILLSFLCWHFHLPALSDEDLDRILHLCHGDQVIADQDRKILLQFFPFHFRVGDRFRTVVTEYYLRLSGMQQPLKDLIQFDFLGRLRDSATWIQKVDQLAEIVLPSNLVADNKLSPGDFLIAYSKTQG